MKYTEEYRVSVNILSGGHYGLCAKYRYIQDIPHFLEHGVSGLDKYVDQMKYSV